MREVSCRRQQGVAPAGGHTYTFHFPLTHLHRNPAEPQPAQTAAPEHPHAPKLQGDPQVWRSRLHPSTHSRRVAYPPSSCTTRAAAGRKIHPRQNVKCVGATPGRPTPGRPPGCVGATPGLWTPGLCREKKVRGRHRATAPREMGPPQEDQEKRRFRVRECGDLSTHREPRNRTRRSVCEEDHTCPEGEETGHQRMKPESRRRSPESDWFRRNPLMGRLPKGFGP